MNSDTAESVRYVTKSFAIKKPVDEVLCAGRFNSFRCALPRNVQDYFLAGAVLLGITEVFMGAVCLSFLGFLASLLPRS